MLNYKLIKRKFKITDSNIADFFNYKNRISFFTSSLRDMVMAHVERTHDHFSRGGVKEAVRYIEEISWPATVSAVRKEQYKKGLLEFLDVINHQTRTGKVVDPLNRPRKPWQKNKFAK